MAPAGPPNVGKSALVAALTNTTPINSRLSSPHPDSPAWHDAGGEHSDPADRHAPADQGLHGALCANMSDTTLLKESVSNREQSRILEVVQLQHDLPRLSYCRLKHHFVQSLNTRPGHLPNGSVTFWCPSDTTNTPSNTKIHPKTA